MRSIVRQVVASGRFSESNKLDLVLDPLGYKYCDLTMSSSVIGVGGWYVNIAGSDWGEQSADWLRLAIPEAQVSSWLPLL